MGKVLVVVDYQKDFVDGALGFAGAKELEAGLLALVEEYIQNNWPVVFTLDTHGPDYLSTREGKHLPLPHCRKSTEGWRLYGRLERFMEEDHPHVYLAPKFAFGDQSVRNGKRGDSANRLPQRGGDYPEPPLRQL